MFTALALLLARPVHAVDVDLGAGPVEIRGFFDPVEVFELTPPS